MDKEFTIFDLAEMLKADESWEADPEVRAFEAEMLILTLLNA